MSASEGYDFVPLPRQVHREPRTHARFDRRSDGTMRVILHTTLTVVQPVHIGAGHWALRNGSAARAAVRSGERPIVPGSSLKGVIRARYEAITKSCCMGHRAPRSRKLDHKLPSKTFAGFSVTFDDRIRRHDVFSPCTPARMCSSCALFGLMSRRSRVAVHDMVAAEGTRFEDLKLPERFSPRPHHLGKFETNEHEQRLEVKRLHGRKFHLGKAPRPSNHSSTEWAETIPKGTQLTGKIIGTNLTPAELGGLLSALGCSPASPLKIGSAKAYRFGLLDIKVGVDIRWPEKDHVRLFEEARGDFEKSPDYHRDGEHALIRLHRSIPS